MKPFIKWQGGKRRELPNIRPYVKGPVAEPFCGGAAVAFDAEGKVYLNDVDKRLINLYRTVADINYIHKLLHDVEQFKKFTPEDLSDYYYKARSYLNSNQTFDDPYEKAKAFLFIRQQAFSGMERYNSKGEFNVPWGHYKTFSCNLTFEHHKLLNRATLSNMDAVDWINTLPNDVFLFIDPPYLERAGYENKDGGFELHQRLHKVLSTCTMPWLIVHSDHEFYRDMYSNFDIKEKPFKYAQQFHGGDYNSKVNHLYISTKF
jgi:DNA adenine methylase